MEQEALRQYISLKAEIADLEARIRRTREEINRLESGKILVADSVKGTRPDGTYGSIRITGYAYSSAERLRYVLDKREQELKKCQDRLLDIVNEAEEYVSGVSDSRIRRMLRYRYMDGLSWVQVAQKMGRKCTAEGCRKQIERFMRSEGE